MLLAQDAEKAFDNVKWQWLELILDRMGLTGEFQVLIRGMYYNPTAQICMTGHLSSYILLTKGTWQGCPLSPLLFDLAVEPLARLLEDSDLFQGIQLHNEVAELALFADDVILFLSDPVSHLSPILLDFGLVSGYKVNITKRELLELGCPISTSAWRQLDINTESA